jgi:hypothetical protein
VRRALASAHARDAAAVPQLIPSEVVHAIDALVLLGALTALREWTSIAMPNVVAIVDVTVKVRRSMEPPADADEYAHRGTLVLRACVMAASAFGVAALTA